jgi:hypothetical protein
MSSTSKRPRAHSAAAGELVTNWTIVRIVAGLVVLAGGCLAFNVWWPRLRPVPDEAAEAVPKMPPLRAARVKSHELRRELVLFSRPRPVSPTEPERPPERGPPRFGFGRTVELQRHFFSLE